jgi:hypothetical protein
VRGGGAHRPADRHPHRHGPCAPPRRVHRGPGDRPGVRLGAGPGRRRRRRRGGDDLAAGGGVRVAISTREGDGRVRLRVRIRQRRGSRAGRSRTGGRARPLRSGRRGCW